ncbi:LPS O-antigen length regulator [Aliidiomarina sedimenti]|uniref:LPS O-antigen length regulator n=1 Tax=Aliidiomarina sedimenti TaxID=1933879 RepID=A0ABY0BZ07_9GAMM|nr:Wzz/FepE/Etk N-terminal domain-containing protein [Aliidiomarina sedimenti]RUO30000.1 LPS O-antigen length regulator [Aliidiomarina sedimenti]
MTEQYQHAPQRHSENDEIDLRELFAILWKGKWIIIAITFAFAVGSVIYALSLPNIYAAEAKLAPTEEAQGGLRDMDGQLGGLASLAGLNMGQNQITPAIIAMEILQSRKFLSEFIVRHKIQPELLAVKEWDANSGELIIDRDAYNPETGNWLREVDPPKQPEPSSWELVDAFRELLIVEQGTESPLTIIKVEHRSPTVAKQWVDWLIEDINNEMRERDIEESQRSMEYIEREMTNATLRSTQQIFSGLMEQQTQTIMLANVRPEYIYRVVDPAVVPEQRAKPSRAIIAIVGTFLGGFLSLIVVLILNLITKDKSA